VLPAGLLAKITFSVFANKLQEKQSVDQLAVAILSAQHRTAIERIQMQLKSTGPNLFRCIKRILNTITTARRKAELVCRNYWQSFLVGAVRRQLLFTTDLPSKALRPRNTTEDCLADRLSFLGCPAVAQIDVTKKGRESENIRERFRMARQNMSCNSADYRSECSDLDIKFSTDI